MVPCTSAQAVRKCGGYKPRLYGFRDSSALAAGQVKRQIRPEGA